MEYENYSNLKEKLDMLLEKHQSQPVGKGYIDIIVKRDRYRTLAREILKLGFSINAISWWEYVDSLNEDSEYGIGGPPSKYLRGWFSELIIDIDDINIQDSLENQLKEIVGIVENKEIDLPNNEKITFRENYFLTPGFWLEIPEGRKGIIDMQMQN